MKINVRLYFKDGSHMAAFLNKKKELSRVFILDDVYKITLSRDVCFKEGGVQKVKEEITDIYYIGRVLTPALVKKNEFVLKIFREEQIKKALDNGDRFILLRDGKSFAKAPSGSKIIDPSMINGGYISPDVDIYNLK